ncbi:MAG: ABC transporter permease [Myxococcaceae bacterium]|nr:ABC transporter permease [Myxococcaceae bacterium]
MRWLRFAWRNLWRSRRRSSLSLLGLVVGLAAMVGQRAVMAGAQRLAEELSVQGRLGAVQVHRVGYVDNVLAPALSLAFDDRPQVRDALGALPHVTAVAGRLEFGALLSTEDAPTRPGRAEPLLVTAVEPGPEARATPLRPGLGGLRDGAVVLDAALAADLEHDGAPALLATDRDGLLNGVPVSLAPPLPAAAPGDLRAGLTTLGTAQALLRMQGQVTEYALAVEPVSAAPDVKLAAQAVLGEGYEVHTWAELNPALEVLGRSRARAFAMTFSILLLVVALGLVNAMLISVLERTREVGTMLALGLRRWGVVRLMMLEGALLGAFGGVLGAGLGALAIAITHEVGLAMVGPEGSLPVVVRPTVDAPFLLAVALVAPVACALISLVPALRAARLSPREALATP